MKNHLVFVDGLLMMFCFPVSHCFSILPQVFVAYCLTYIHLNVCRLVWILFIIFTSVHIWANYSAVTNVIMESLNQARLHILVKDFFSRDHVSLPSIKETNYREPVIISKSKLNTN